jgi:hypothetical protein
LFKRFEGFSGFEKYVACWVFEPPEPLKNQTEKTKLKQDEMNRNAMAFSHNWHG